jgi:hypothetical protein
MYPKTLLTIWLSGLFSILLAADPVLAPVKPVRANEAPVIDGVLDEAIWQEAPSVSGFKTFVPDYGREMGHDTRVLMAYDAENLYFAFECFDDPGLIKTSVAQRDKIRDDDWVCINLDSYDDKQSLYALYVNPSGIQMDTRYSNGQEDAGADFVWYSKATIHEKGYTIEIRLPLKSIRYSVRDNLVKMGVIFERKISRMSIQGTYPPLDPDMGMAFLMQSMPLMYENLKPNTLVELLPALTYGKGVTAVEGQDVSDGGKPDFGLTGKFGLSSDLVLDATWNPDFSQVESDARQIDDNVRFALFFPERRPFFLEGNENFIVAGTGEELRSVVNSRSIVNPDVALKFSGKLGDKNRIAAIYASDAGTDRAATDPNDQVMIARYIRALKGDSFIGGVYTRRAEADRSNDVAALDATIRLTQASTISGHFVESLNHHFSDDSRTDNHAMGLQYALDKRNLTMQGSFYQLSRGFNTSVGFVERTGITRYSFFVNPKLYPKSELLIRIDNNISLSQTLDHESGLWEKSLGYTLNTRWIRNTVLGAGFNIQDEVFRGIKFKRNRFSVNASSLPNKRLLLSTRFSHSGKIRYIFDENILPYAGRGTDASGSVNWQASDQFNSTLTLVYSDFTRESDGIQEFSRTILRSRNIFQLNQYFLFRTIVEYDTRAKDLFADFLASFTLIPGTVVHVGYGSMFHQQLWDNNRMQYEEADRFYRQRSSFFFKASYLWRL